MKDYLLLFRGGDTGIAALSAEDKQAHMAKWGQWIGGLAEQGIMKGAEPLWNTGKTIAGKDKVVSDGPYAEGKELLGGYLMCAAKDYDAAVTIGKGCPVLDWEDGNVEVREIQVMDM